MKGFIMLNNLIFRSITLITVMGMWTSVDASSSSRPSSEETKKFMEYVIKIHEVCVKMNDQVNHPVPNENPVFTKLCEDISKIIIEKNKKK